MLSFRKLYVLILVSLLSCNSYAESSNAKSLAKEFHITALFLYNFANFVEWPEHAFNTNKNLTMCLYGSVPFGGFLDKVDGTRIKSRRLKIMRTSSAEELTLGCHILFVGVDQLSQIQELFNNMDHLFVLSIGKIDGFTEKGGIVNILRTQDQQKFEINLSQAIKNGLLIDSDLLNLARIINTK